MRPANAPSPRMRWAKTPFARRPCTQTAIRAGALNHPHHTNPMNHSSDKYQPTLIHALTPVNPFHPPPKRPPAQPVPAPRDHARGPSTASRLPSCTQNFLTQSLVNSRELSSISRKCAPAFATPPSAAKGPPARPVLARRDHTRGLHQPPRLPSCAQNFLPNLTHSLVISRLTLLHLCLPLTLQSIGQRGDSYRLPAAKIPLRFARFSCTKTAICAAAVNHPHHIIT